MAQTPRLRVMAYLALAIVSFRSQDAQLTRAREHSDERTARSLISSGTTERHGQHGTTSSGVIL